MSKRLNGSDIAKLVLGSTYEAFFASGRTVDEREALKDSLMGAMGAVVFMLRMSGLERESDQAAKFAVDLVYGSRLCDEAKAAYLRSLD